MTENEDAARPNTQSPYGAPARWISSVASVLSSAAAMVCPACIPALGSSLASLGLGFAMKTAFVRPLLAALLAISLGSLIWSAKLHGRWWILLPAAVGAVTIYISYAVWFRPTMMWTGAALLVGASLVNFKLKRKCCHCPQVQPPTDQP